MMVLLAVVSACSDGSVDCGSSQALETVDGIVRTAIEENTSGLVRGEDGRRLATNAELRAAIARAELAVEQVRTTSRDPNSTKRFCSASLAITLPADLIESAETTRRLSQQEGVEALADQNNITRQANRFTAQVEYSVQPTDDGSELFAELQDADHIFSFASQVIGAHLLNRDARAAQAQAENQAAEQRSAEARQQQEENAALAQQQAVAMDQAREDHRFAQQTINQVWEAIPASTRRTLLTDQRGWLRRKVADCRVEAASAGIEQQQRELTRLACEARLDRGRADYLRRYVGYEAPEVDPLSTLNRM